MSYSKERERENKALKALLKGDSVEKRVMVGYEGDKQESGDKIDRLSDIMKDARMPMFCPKCGKVMKIKLDNKMWLLYNHCFDCQIKIENKLRIQGKYSEYEEEKVKNNKRAYIKDMLNGIQEWKEKTKTMEKMESVGVQTPEVAKEKWNINSDHINKMADDAEKFLKEQLSELD